MASSIFGNQGGSSVLDGAIGTLNGMGAGSASAGDAMMRMLYNSNPQVRAIVDQNRDRSIDDLLRERGVDPQEARRRFGI